MYRHILIALDNSDLSRGVMQQAIALAQGTDAKLTLLHVLCTRILPKPQRHHNGAIPRRMESV
jgi:nucleotide-binding universal stress UspA family protein